MIHGEKPRLLMKPLNWCGIGSGCRGPSVVRKDRYEY